MTKLTTCTRAFCAMSARMRISSETLRVDRPEHRVGVHHDLVRGERDQGAAAHRIVRHEHRHLPLSLDQRLGDLLRGEHQPARRVQDDVDRLLRGRQADGTQHGLGIVDADASRHRDAEQASAFLAVDHRDHPGIALALELAEGGRALPVEAARAGELQQDDDYEQQPERRARDIREVLRPKTRGSFHRQSVKFRVSLLPVGAFVAGR